jgi:hypothetical protein
VDRDRLARALDAEVQRPADCPSAVVKRLFLEVGEHRHGALLLKAAVARPLVKKE